MRGSAASSRARRSYQILFVAGLASVGFFSQAEPLASNGCPISHCTPQATGIIDQPLIPSVLTITTNDALGSLHAEGCTGNETRLMCLYIHDTAPADRRGTLKVLDATTLKPIWGSSETGSYNLDPQTAANGQVPVIFADGSIAAGDATHHVWYDSSGITLGVVSLKGSGNNFGITPISADYAVVSQGDGVLTLVDLATWRAIDSLQLTDPMNGLPINLVGPSSASVGVLYAIGYSSHSGDGVLFSVVVGEKHPKLKVRSAFNFVGQSGAAAVVVTSAQTGLADNLVLLHVPGLVEDPIPENRLLGLSDSPGGLAVTWAIPLALPLTVSPTVDQATKSLFYQLGLNVYQGDLLTGSAIKTFDLQTIGGFPASFRLISHMGASEVGSVFTLLLTGTYATSRTGGQQTVVAFQPIESPNALLWSAKISDVTGGYSGGWNFARSSQRGVVCPIAISIDAAKSTIVRLCDH